MAVGLQDCCQVASRCCRRVDQPHFYRLRLEGALDVKWSDWFDGLELCVEGGETVLSGWVPDQPALYGLFERARDLGLSLIALERLA